MGKILAHIDYLDESIGDLSVEVERVIAPFAEPVELLDTIPGVNRRTAETLERSVAYEERGEDYFDRGRSSETYAKRLVRQLERVGHKVALEPLAQTV